MSEAPDSPDGKVRVPLSKPIPAHGEDVTELVFREPNGADIARCGNPVLINPATVSIEDVRFDEPKMNRMMAALAGVPLSTIEKLPGGDWQICAWTVAGFFLPTVTMPSSSASS